MDDLTSLISGIGATGAGIFGGTQSKANTDYSVLYNGAKDYLNFAKSNYADPNSAYYTKAKKSQFNSLYDMMLASINKNNAEIYGQGYVPSAKMLATNTTSAYRTAGTGANQFAEGMFNNGMNQVGNAYQSYLQTITQAKGLETSEAISNSRNNNDMFSGITGAGMNMLGQYSQSMNNKMNPMNFIPQAPNINNTINSPVNMPKPSWLQ